MRVPALWRLVEDEVDKGTYVESKWRNPANRQDALVIDMSQASGEAPKGQAEPVRQLLRKAESYREISYDATSDLPWQAWRWDFEISDKRRVDYFFSACGHDFAVLGSTSPARFAALGDTFRQVAASVQSGCNGG